MSQGPQPLNRLPAMDSRFRRAGHAGGALAGASVLTCCVWLTAFDRLEVACEVRTCLREEIDWSQDLLVKLEFSLFAS